MLRKLAAGHMLFELSDAGRGEWDQFQIRNVGLAIQRHMARDFGSEAQRIINHSVDFVGRNLGLPARDGIRTERSARENFSLLLAMMPIESWDASEKQLAVLMIDAKGSGDESRYLKLMQKHAPLRAEVISLGS
jgi:hypothetical protein